VYGALRARLEQAGQVIGGNDMLIAAQAIAFGLTVVTNNEREFSRIKELRCENWLRQGKAVRRSLLGTTYDRRHRD
jgi:tRNA(fMet)-specific endonuclease VapC